MTNYILVHGGNVSSNTWNSLRRKEEFPPGERLGRRVWDTVSTRLVQQGHHVFAPTLKHECKYNLSDHIQQICDLIHTNQLTDIILVGHSYGGMVITGVASRLPEKIKQLVYLDAVFPTPGQSLVSLLRQYGDDPEKVLDGSPKAYEEPIQFEPDNIKNIPKCYVLCRDSQFAWIKTLAKSIIDADKDGWTCVELPTHHLPMASMPDELAQFLMQKLSH